MIEPRHPIHPMDCRCAKCPDPRGTREERHWRLVMILLFYGVTMAVSMVVAAAIFLKFGGAR